MANGLAKDQKAVYKSLLKDVSMKAPEENTPRRADAYRTPLPENNGLLFLQYHGRSIYQALIK